MSLRTVIPFLLCLLLPVRSIAQPTPCPKYTQAMRLGQQYFTAQQYDRALQEFLDAQVAARECRLSADSATVARERVEAVFAEVQRQKGIAEQARKRADSTAHAAARKARANANALLALQTSKTDPAAATRLAAMNYQLYPEAETSWGMFDEVLYQQPNQAKALHTFGRKHSAPVTSVAISPDGRYLITGSEDHTAKLWDIASGEELRSFAGHSDRIYSVAVSPDGRSLITGSKDKTAKLWEIESGKEVRSFAGHSDAVSSVAVSPDGRYLISGSWDKTAKLWDIETGEEVRSFAGHSKAVSSVAISPDGRYLITGSGDQTAKLWDIASGEEVHSFAGHSKAVSSVAISPDGRSFFTVGDTPQPCQHWLPWTYLNQHVEPYDITQLKAMGLQFTWEDYEEMLREGRNWSQYRRE